jgi:hypothetical protein
MQVRKLSFNCLIQSTSKCGVDVLPTKLRPVKIENENDFEIFEESKENIIINLSILLELLNTLVRFCIN